MKRPIQPLTIFFILIYFFSYTVYAQPSFNFNNTSQTPSQPQTGRQTLSPDEFKNAVNQMGQQTQNRINQQVKSQYKTPGPAATSPLSTPTPPTPIAAPPSNPAQAAPYTGYANPSYPSRPSYAPNQPSVYSTQPPPPPSPARGYGTQGPPTQNQVYTGFGPPPNVQNNGANNPTTGNNGGWNIKY